MADERHGCRLLVSTSALRSPNEPMVPVLMTMGEGPPIQATRAEFLRPMIARVKALEAGTTASAGDLGQRLDALKATLAMTNGAVDTQARALGALADRTTTQEQATTALATRAGALEAAGTATAARVAAAETAASKLTDRVTAAETAATALTARTASAESTITSLSSRIASVEAGVSSLVARMAAAETTATALAARVAALEAMPKQVAAFTASAKVPALALASSGTITLTPLTASKTGDVLKAGERIVVEPQSALPAGLVVTSARVTADGTVTLQVGALVAIAAGSTALTWNVTALRG